MLITSKGTIIAVSNKLRRYEIIVNKQENEYEKDFYATDCSSYDAFFMRNDRQICLIR